MAREPDMVVRLVADGEEADQVVGVLGDQVLTATPADVGKVVTVAADGTLVLSAGGGGGVTDHGDLTGLTDADHTIAAVTGLQAALDLKAPLASPALTGNPTAPTPAAADNDTSIATTAFVQTELGSYVRTAQAVNAQTGTTYTLVAADAGKLVTLSNAGAITLTLPQDSDAVIAIGTYVDLLTLGAGQVTVVAGTGATLRTSGLTAKSRAQYARLGVQKVSANTWSLFGDLAAS